MNSVWKAEILTITQCPLYESLGISYLNGRQISHDR
jgi:hypothetical protein